MMSCGCEADLPMRHRLSCVLALALVTVACLSQATEAIRGQLVPHPDDPSKRIEVFMKKPNGSGPWPAVILLHGHQEGPRAGGADFVKWGVLDRLANRGYVAIAISQPGYGNSSGPPDFCGPFTQHAVMSVLSMLRSTGYVIPTKIAIEGISRGAVVAGLVSAQDSQVSALVLISGVYDLSQFVANPRRARMPTARGEIVDSIKQEAGVGGRSLQIRSVLRTAKNIKASTLIISGQNDDRADPNQARQLADAIKKAGGTAQLVVFPQCGHKIPPELRDRVIDPFLDSILQN